MLTALTITLRSVLGEVYLSKAFEDFYIHIKDKMIINLDEYVAGDGSIVQVESFTRNAVVENQFTELQNVTLNSTRNCTNILMIPGQIENIYSMCQENVLVKTLASGTNKETLLPIAFKNVSNDYDCHELAISEELNLIVVGCLDRENSKILLKLVRPDQLVEIASQIDDIVVPDGQIIGSQDKVRIKISNTSVVVWANSTNNVLRLYSISLERGFTSKGKFVLLKNINSSVAPAEKCLIQDVMGSSSQEAVYMLLDCEKNSYTYFMKCFVKNETDEGGLRLDCGATETFYESRIKQKGGPLMIFRKSPHVVTRNSDLVHFLNSEALILIDFAKGIMKEVYVFKGLRFDTTFEIMEGALYGKYLYLVARICEETITRVAIITASIYRNYFRVSNLFYSTCSSSKKLMTKIVPQDQSKSKMSSIMIFQPSQQQIRIYEEYSLLALRFDIYPDDIKTDISDEAHSQHKIYVNISIGSPGNLVNHKFNLFVLANETLSAELNLPKGFEFYKDTLPILLPLSKQSIQGYGPKLTVTHDDGKKNYEVEYVRKMRDTTKANTLPYVISDKNGGLLYLNKDIFLVFQGVTIRLLQFSPSLRQNTTTFSLTAQFDLPINNSFLAACIGDDNSIFILCKSSVATTRLLVYNMTAKELKELWNIPFAPELSAMLYNPGLLEFALIRRSFNNGTILEYFRYDLTKMDEDAKTFSRYPYLPEDICPNWITFSSKRLPIVFIESSCTDVYEVYELYMLNDREDDPVMKIYKTKAFPGLGAFCPFDKNIVFVDESTKTIIGYDRASNLQSKSRFYPFQEYGGLKIIDLDCDVNNPFMAVLSESASGEYMAMVYRVEESGDNALRRVHSIIKLPLKTKDARIRLHTEARGVQGYVTIVDEGKFETYSINLAVPKVEISTADSDIENLQFNVEVEGSKTSATSRVDLKFVHQNYQETAEVVNKVSPLFEQEYNLENQLKFDGMFIRSFLEVNGNLAMSNIQRYSDRLTKVDSARHDKISVNARSNITKIIIEKNIVLGWNDNEIEIYENMILKLKYEVSLLELNSCMESSRHFPIFTGLLLNESRKAVMVVFWRNIHAEWKVNMMHIENDLIYMKGVLTGDHTIAYLAYNPVDNSIVAGEVIINPLTQELQRHSLSVKTILVDQLETLDGFGANGKLVGVVRRRRNDIGSIYEMVRNELTGKMQVMRRVDLVLYPNQPQFITEQFGCQSKYNEAKNEVEGYCVGYSRGIYSYANKIVLRGGTSNKWVQPMVKTIGRSIIQEGYRAMLFEYTADYYMLMLVPLRATSSKHKYLIVVYKIDENHAHPYVTLTPSAVHDDASHEVLDLSFYTSLSRTPSIALLLSLNGNIFIQSYAIGPMRMLVRENADKEWSGNEQLVIEYQDSANSISMKRIPLTNILGNVNERADTSGHVAAYLVSLGMIIIITITIVTIVHVLTKWKMKMNDVRHVQDETSDCDALSKLKASIIEKSFDTNTNLNGMPSVTPSYYFDPQTKSSK